MKTPLAAVLSISGVISAGGIAFAANTNLLDSGAPTVSGNPAQTAVITTTPATTTGSSVIVETTVDGSTTTTILAVPSTTTPGTTIPPVAATNLVTYQVPGVGAVTIQESDTSIVIDAVAVEAGWKYKIDDSSSATRVEVEFTSQTLKIEFHARLLAGRIITSIRNTTATPVSLPAPNRNGDDDNDDDHGNEDREDNGGGNGDD